MEETSPFSIEGGARPACVRKECWGCWEVLWGSGLALGLSLDVFTHAPQAILSLAVCIGVWVSGCRESKKGETWGRKGTTIIMC